jgi:hypothetical protein
MPFTNLEKTDMVLINGKARGHSELARQIHGKMFPQRILPNARIFVNVVWSPFSISGVSKWISAILPTNEKIAFRCRRRNCWRNCKSATNKYSVCCKLTCSFSVCSLAYRKVGSKAYIHITFQKFRHQNYKIYVWRFILFFYSQLQFFYFVV